LTFNLGQVEGSYRTGRIDSRTCERLSFRCSKFLANFALQQGTFNSPKVFPRIIESPTTYHDRKIPMTETEPREIADSLFEPKSREEMKDAIRLEEARRAAIVKNLYRLRALRLERNAKQSTKND
jgi:hypothetical protein